MTILVKDLVPTKTLETADTEQYACEVSAAIIDKITIYNSSASVAVVVEITITKVVSGVSPGWLMRKTLTPQESYTCPEISGFGMVAGDHLSTNTSAGTVIMRVTGREIS